jgi:hypothetical protein
MIILLVERAPVQPMSEAIDVAEDIGREEPSPSVVDWDAVDDERCGLFP